MTHYVNSIEYRRGEDDIEYTYEEFQEFYGDKEGEVKWKEAGDKTIRLVFDEKKVKYKLYLYIVDEDVILKEKYEKAIKKWNNNMMTSNYPDAGFDLFTPLCEKSKPYTNNMKKVDYRIKLAMYKNSEPVSFTMHPRSSIYKTPFRLTNSTGIIDSGYRGNLGSIFDIIREEAQGVEWEEKDYERYVQVCGPSLKRFYVELVENEEDLGLNTERGTGGFGSTGR
tara:strand:- start:36 stop:707 length:672 start_codon:yes stop_codon:yes gene_type:complete